MVNFHDLICILGKCVIGFLSWQHWYQHALLPKQNRKIQQNMWSSLFSVTGKQATLGSEPWEGTRGELVTLCFCSLCLFFFVCLWKQGPRRKPRSCWVRGERVQCSGMRTSEGSQAEHKRRCKEGSGPEVCVEVSHRSFVRAGLQGYAQNRILLA